MSSRISKGLQGVHGSIGRAGSGARRAQGWPHQGRPPAGAAANGLVSQVRQWETLGNGTHQVGRGDCATGLTSPCRLRASLPRHQAQAACRIGWRRWRDPSIPGTAWCTREHGCRHSWAALGPGHVVCMARVRRSTGNDGMPLARPKRKRVSAATLVWLGGPCLVSGGPGSWAKPSGQSATRAAHSGCQGTTTTARSKMAPRSRAGGVRKGLDGCKG